jgi:hypothetical protein
MLERMVRPYSAPPLLWIRASALVGMIGPPLFAILAIIGAFLEPNYDWVRQTISQLVWGSVGWLQTVSFILFAFCLAILAGGLTWHWRGKSARWLSFGLLLLAFGFLLIACFPTDYPGFRTAIGIWHQQVTRSAILLFVLCAMLSPVLFWSDISWRDLSIAGVIVAAITLGMALGWDWFPPAWIKDWKGLYERLMLLPAFLWLELISSRLWKLSYPEKR